jgi:hypothetical protein
MTKTEEKEGKQKKTKRTSRLTGGNGRKLREPADE